MNAATTRSAAVESRDQSVAIGPEPEWYKDAVIYQLHIKAYQDTSGDGIGDFKGLIQRLDYIQELGATAIWLLPFYPSPLRDDGYDISDYRRINPVYGKMPDFRRFVREAHARGLRVITELVINHTSDQHPWFQRARRAKPGSPERDFYVWSDTDEYYQGTRIIFLDTEASNWTWDPVANAYFWHRFYSHQPDLNFDNPAVLDEVIRTMRYWLDMGVDGLRLDAIPYLVERDGTNNENLPETHAVLKKIRAALDAEYDDRMLLAEANQWPEDTAPYFGNGDECHMAFHFPLMPRMYMAVAQEDRHPITDIIRQMPDIPASCQWAIFLRNHDELTLEMVTENERDYLWQTYAGDRRARLNLGIRRRLAPLMQNDRRKIELMNALLLSMPGTPVIYYGDEIGMGDNIFLGDRDGVRTPMQWTSDRNGGFSRVNPQQLYLPAIMDPVYGFAAVNVEAQEGDASSLLNWMRRLLAVRAARRSFGRGSIRFLYPANRKVLAFVREHEGERTLCVANLSRSAQAVELDLSPWEGAVPVELSSGEAFPPVGQLPYLLTFPGYGFFWFGLDEHASEPSWHEALPGILPEFVTLTATDGSIGSILTGRERRQLEQDVLPEFLPLQRWFGEKHGSIRSVEVEEIGELETPTSRMTLAHVSTDDGRTPYFMPLSIQWGEKHLTPGAPLLSHTLAKARKGPRLGAVVDGAFDDAFVLDIVSAMREGGASLNPSSGLACHATDALRDMPEPSSLRRLTGEQSNVSVIVDDALVLKIYRRLQQGTQPDVEVGRFLTETAGFDGTPAYLGDVEYRTQEGPPTTLATAFSFVPNQGDAWAALLDALVHDLERTAMASGSELEPGEQNFSYPLDIAEALGRRTAEMHAALATASDDPAFSLEPLRKRTLQGWVRDVVREIENGFRTLDNAAVAERYAEDVRALRREKRNLIREIREIGARSLGGSVSRIHGDYHLSQVLIAEGDVVIVDFEGEPRRTLDERRAKTSPLRDVAGMLRSFDYLMFAALDRRRSVQPELREAEIRRAEHWRRTTNEAFLDAYFSRADGLPNLPPSVDDARTLLRLFAIQKAVYELGYEAANRPDWISIPVRGLLEMTGATGTLAK